MMKWLRTAAISAVFCLLLPLISCAGKPSPSSGASEQTTASAQATDEQGSTIDAGDDTSAQQPSDSDDTQSDGLTGTGVTGTKKPTAHPTNATGSKTNATSRGDTVATTTGSGSSNTSYGVTGDTSFSIDTKGLAKNTVYSVTKDVLSGTRNILGHDVLRLFSSLQGLLNRDFNKNKIALIIEPYNSSETFWINYMSASGAPLAGMARKKITSLNDFLNTFKNQLVSCGMVAWDPEVPATSNVAATICGLDGYLPVKYEEGENSLMTMLKGMGVKIKMNLKGRFTGKGIISGTKIASTGSAKCDAYLWAMEKYMARCSTKYMAYMADGASCTTGNIIYENDSDSKDPFGAVNLVSHDYGIVRRAFFFDLTPVGSEAPCDDPKQPIGTDLKTMHTLFNRHYELAKGEFGCMIGFPPWQLKYTSHNGWGTIRDTTVEAMFVQECTKYNKYLDVSFAQPNTSIYCAYPLKSSYKNGNKAVSEKFDSKTIYIYYHLGDYDATAWVMSQMLTAYQDAKRGSLPLTWAVNPGMSDRIPMAFDYYCSNLTAMDTMCTADSGIGYFRPDGIFQDDTSVDGRTLPNGDKKLIAASKPYMQKFGMDLVSFAIGSMSNKAYAMFREFAPAGVFHNDRTKPITIYNGTPFIPTKNGVGNPGDYLTSAKGMYDYLTTTMKGTNFLPTRTICWTPTQLIALTEAFEGYASPLMPGYKFKVVNAYTFMEMVKQSGQGKIVNE